MKKIFSLLCVTSLLLCNMQSVSVQAVEIEKNCTGIAEMRYEGLIDRYSMAVCV